MIPRVMTRDRSDLELVAMQLSALSTWHHQRSRVEAGLASAATSREARMDLDRRLEVLRVQHEAIVERTCAGLVASGGPLRGRVARRAIVAHRHVWFTDRLCAALESLGIEVLARYANGAEAVGACVAEQPDLLVVEDRLAMMGGEDVAREVREFAPHSVIVGQVAYEDGIAAMLSAGADCAFPRRVPPQDVAEALARELEDTERLVAAV